MLLIFSLILSIHTYASETATGGPVVKRGGATAVAKQIKPELKSDSCPPGLTNWVNDDFSDKSTLGMINFPSEAKSCLSTVKTYEDHIKSKSQKPSFNSSEKLSDYLADKYKQISPNAQNVLSQCSSLGDGKSRVAKTRFYTAATRYEAYNSTMLDEIASIDSLIGKDQVVEYLDCNTPFPFPKVNQKCNEYKRMINGSCKQSEAQRLDALVKKTKIAFDEIEEMNTAYKNCVAAKKQDTCNKIKTAIDLKISQYPWINGKVFQDNISATKSNQIVSRHITTEKIKEGIIADLKERRKAYTKQYSQNLQDVRCLTYTTKDNGAPCNFEDVRTNLTKVPNLVEAPPESASAENSEFKNYVESEQCLLERGQDRADSKKVFDDSLKDVGLLALTGGLSVAGRSLRFVQGLSDAAKLRNVALIESVSSGANMAPGLKQAFEACTQKSKDLLKYKDKPEAKKNSLCPDPGSAFEKAKEEQDSCITNALLSGADVLPFVAGLKVFKKLSSLTKEDILKLYKDPAQRAEIEKILAKNGKLTDAERTDGAEKLLGRNLSDAEKNCVLSAHNIGDGRVMKTGGVTDNTLTQADLLAKKSALTGCGFATAEASLLLRAGITGSTPDIAITNLRKASVKVLGRDLTPEQVDAIWEVGGKGRGDDVIATLKKSGFTDEEAQKIVNQDLGRLRADDLKDVRLSEQPKLPPVPARPAPVQLTSSQALSRAFERTNSEGIDQAYKASRAEALKIIDENHDQLITAPEQIVDLSTKGLKAEETTRLLKSALPGDDGFNKALKLIDQRSSKAADDISQNDFEQFKLQEIRVKIMSDHYESKYKDKYNELDVDKFWDEDEAGAKAFQEAGRKLEELRKKNKKDLWPE